jgi:hypothetical protein
MGLDLNYIAGDREFTLHFSMAEWQTLEQLRNHLSDAVSAMFDTPDFGKPQSVTLPVFRAAADAVERLLTERPALLPYPAFPI